MSNQISYISIEKIFPHPKNPRTELGDLTELSDSIRANGILQNLTVVPKMSNGSIIDGFYTVIIGHRRLAAAEKAGLDEVPCVVADMNEKEQVATMMLENLQRSDLTVYEQAKGFQMMFDLGETVKSIAEKTGLSESTIKNRRDLLKLDKDKFKEASDRGATLQEFAELSTIEDDELRGKVLDTVGTANFRNSLMSAKDKEAIAKNKPFIIEQLSRFAEKTKETSGKVYVDSYYVKTFNDFIRIPDDAGHIKYYWAESGSYIYLYKDKIKTLEEIKRDEKAEQIRRSKDILEEISKRAFSLRYDFIDNYPGRKRDIDAINDAVAMMFCNNNCFISFNGKYLAELMGAKNGEFSSEHVKEYYELFPEQALACMVYSVLENAGCRYYDNNLKYVKNETLDRVYDFLRKLGYELSDEELSLKNGTHSLYRE